MFKYNFPENLKKLRKINKLSQLDLAEKLGVTRQSISYYENGNVEPSINFIPPILKPIIEKTAIKIPKIVKILL